MVLLGRLAAGAGALFMPLALAMPFVGLKAQPDDDTVYRDLSGWARSTSGSTRRSACADLYPGTSALMPVSERPMISFWICDVPS